jgi:beta-ureidopropionase / N-carbamoyl-L-amino-acid hydrolase
VNFNVFYNWKDYPMSGASSVNWKRTIDESRFWETLHALAKIGATPAGGVKRLAFSAVDKAGRDQFASWCRMAGMSLSTDAIGNLFALRPGRNTDAPVLMIGSHIDSQPTGGRYDGAYGVMAGLEVVRALNDTKSETEHGIELVAWANEEGARFAPALMGSTLFTGGMDIQTALSTRDVDGRTVAEEMAAHGILDGLDTRPGTRKIKAYLEIHIEQGPVLEDLGNSLGIVSGIQAIRWYDIVVEGQEAHAGPTPMPLRRDALMAASEIALAVEQIALEHSPHGRGTVGTFVPYPASRNVIPGRLEMTADFRHPEEAVVDAMEAALRKVAADIAARRKLTLDVKQFWRAPAIPFDAEVAAVLRKHAIARAGCDPVELFSGAGHDAQRIALVAPAAMLFIPCADGISHNEAEAIEQTDAMLGCSVLLDTVAELAGTID